MVVLAKLRSRKRVAINLSNESGSQKICDISTGGMRVQSNKALRMDEHIEISLAVGDGPISLKGRVVRARRSGLEKLPYEYGFVFDELSARDLQRLARFMDLKGAGDVPAVDLDAGQLLALEKRIAELEKELADAESDASQTRIAMTTVRDASKTRRVRVTHFDADRFERLVTLDQPLTCLVDDPQSRLRDAFHKRVAATFSDDFDLVSVKTQLAGSATHPAIVDALFDCYEQDLIDFS